MLSLDTEDEKRILKIALTRYALQQNMNALKARVLADANPDNPLFKQRLEASEIYEDAVASLLEKLNNHLSAL